MKPILTSLLFAIFLCCSIIETTAQEIVKYDFLEIIVVQKANNRGKVKRIKVEEQPSLEGKIITIKEIEDIDGTAELLNYLNSNNWEFVDRQSIVSEENDPVWMSYIFKKQK